MPVRGEVARAILESFPETEPPFDLELPMDEGEDGELFEAVLGGKSWYRLDLGQLRQSELAPSGLSREAFHYYLPAFMLASLDFEESGTLGASTYLCLRPETWNPDRVDRAKWTRDVCTVGQRRAVRSFLEYLYTSFPNEYSFKFEYRDETLAF